jgi:DinB superfamily
MPDTAEYLARVRNYAEGKDPLALQKETPTILQHLIAGASADQVTRPPAPGKWSVGEILAHLAEDEIATAWRYRQMVEHNGIELPGFDQDLWSRLGDYASRSPEESLELFRLLRQANLQFLGQLSPEQWECYGIHAERGRITVRDLAAHMAGHDANHVEQIRNILGRTR